MTRLHVGNIIYTSSEAELRALFEQYGEVRDIRLLINPITNRFRGDMFVSMDAECAREAIKILNGVEFGGRRLRVTEAVTKVRAHTR